MGLTLAEINKIASGISSPDKKEDLPDLTSDQEALIAKARQKRVESGRYS